MRNAMLNVFEAINKAIGRKQYDIIENGHYIATYWSRNETKAAIAHACNIAGLIDERYDFQIKKNWSLEKYNGKFYLSTVGTDWTEYLDITKKVK